jgi:hypothetical protein
MHIRSLPLDLFAAIAYTTKRSFFEVMMPPSLFRSLPAVAAVLIIGCATTLPTFTESVRREVQADGLDTCILHVGTSMEFRSLRELDPSTEEGPMKKDPHRYVKLSLTDTGRAVAGGNGWITVDFGRGILLTFNARGNDSIYTTRGWGTVTIEGERYDIMVGVLSGSDVTLRYDPRR